MRVAILFGLLLFVGAVLLLSEHRWFKRTGLSDRLQPYSGAETSSKSAGFWSVASFREVIAPLSQMIGERLARAFGVREELAMRLRRIHSDSDEKAFRIRQIGWAGAAFMGAAIAAIALGLPPALAIFLVFGAPILAFLALEQKVVAASNAWQQRLALELPVVAEQLAMLMSAGWSLGAALDRVAMRGSGNCSKDLKRVVQRIRMGLNEVEALEEWSEIAKVEALESLVAILALNREASNLGDLISKEARTMRLETQRELIEEIEKRTQQVWIPVTVATLVPGLLLMGIPFLEALTLFSSS